MMASYDPIIELNSHGDQRFRDLGMVLNDSVNAGFTDDIIKYKPHGEPVFWPIKAARGRYALDTTNDQLVTDSVDDPSGWHPGSTLTVENLRSAQKNERAWRISQALADTAIAVTLLAGALLFIGLIVSAVLDRSIFSSIGPWTALIAAPGTAALIFTLSIRWRRRRLIAGTNSRRHS